jgi:hypothetical protein
MTHEMRHDDLISRLRARAADPQRRADVRVDAFSTGVRTLSLGDLMTMGRGLAGQLGAVVDANRGGRPVSADATRTAGAIAGAMSTPARPDLPPVATEGAVAAAEAEIGRPLPAFVRRLYLEVADGGFGPGEGLLPIAAVADAYRGLRAEPQGPQDQPWPADLVPLVRHDPGLDCVDLDDGRIVGWDPEEMAEAMTDRGWRRSFKPVAESADAWLEAWVGAKSPQEEMQERVAASMLQQAREARAAIGRMSPEERRKMGLPDVGWERVVWGGLGLDEDG